MSIEENFNLAANFIQSSHNEFGKTELLQFYAFYKQATTGSSLESNRPPFYKVQDRAKFDSWSSCGTMNKDQAMKSYVELLTNLKPSWNEETSADHKSSGSFGPCVSRPKSEDFLEDSEKSIEDFIKEGNIGKLRKLLENIEENEVNALDESGLGLIHWCADRGDAEILKLILCCKNIQVDLKDIDGQSALFYASSNGHESCLRLLLQNGASKEQLDNEGNSCLDVAYDEEIRKMLA